MTELQDLENTLKLAMQTGKLFAGSEMYKMFSALPETDCGSLTIINGSEIEVVENAWLEPYVICAIKTDNNEEDL